MPSRWLSVLLSLTSYTRPMPLARPSPSPTCLRPPYRHPPEREQSPLTPRRPRLRSAAAYCNIQRVSRARTFSD